MEETVKCILNGFHTFATKDIHVKNIVKGYFRALEITYNEKAETFHPHIHAILLVDKRYFNSDDYLQTSQIVQIWRRVCKLDYDPICDIRRTKTPKGKRKEVAEVAKYTLKDTEIFKKGMEMPEMDFVVKYLSQALKGRRLYAFGGLMKEIAKELNCENADGGDLVNIDGETVRADLVKCVIDFNWCFGRANYFRAE
ncbi:Replication protein [Bacteroidales bacterium Barb7]|nr:Replication protein [Bacteroidales bacterium Barb7]